jgi:hypothetical protein
MADLKIVGSRDPARTAEWGFKAALQLQRVAKTLGRWQRPKGLVIKGRTWEEAEALWQARLKEMDASNG